LLHCLLSPSAPDSAQEIAALARNQHRVAARGREPGLQLEREGAQVGLLDWGLELLAGCEPIAQLLDEDLRGTPLEGAHEQAWQEAQQALHQPQSLPSARVLQALTEDFDRSFIAFARSRSEHTRRHFMAQPLRAQERDQMRAQSAESVLAQQRIESLDSLPFEMYRQQYISAERLGRAGAG
jgi:glutamate--cysteine ligase